MKRINLLSIITALLLIALCLTSCGAKSYSEYPEEVREIYLQLEEAPDSPEL